jgi:signal transduction histidine kinase
MMPVPSAWALEAIWHGPMAVAVFSGPDHVVTFANPRCLAMIGRQAIVGQRIVEVLPELAGTPALQMLHDVHADGQARDIHQCRVKLKAEAGLVERSFSGRLSVLAQPMPGAGGEGESHERGVLVVLTEVSDQVRTREVLEKAHEERAQLLAEVKSLRHAKHEFLALLGHELRNPLAPIVSALEIIGRHPRANHFAQVAMIERQANTLVRLVDDLLGVSALHHAQVKIKLEPVSMAEVIDEVLHLMQPELGRQSHLVERHVEGTLMCNGDRARLVQAVTQVMSNAIRYTRAPGLIRVTARREHDSIVVRIRDNGRGIPADALPHIFELFYQGHQESDRPEGGLGVGLTVARNLLELHSGSIVAHSEGPGLGSEFTICLPAFEASRSAPLDEPDAAEPLRILVVDDNEDAAQSLAMLLRDTGHEVQVATTALPAIELAKRFLPQVAILDIGLPGMDGYELGRRLRMELGAHACRLIALTGYGHDRDRQRSVAFGFSDHLIKPVDLDRLEFVLGRDA